MPQLEDGYTRIANELLDAIISNRIPGEQMQCFLFILRKTYGYQKKEDMIALSQFVEASGMSKAHICRSLKTLEEKNLIVAKKGNRITTTYCVNKNYKLWEALPKKVTLPKMEMPVAKNGNETLPKMGHTKEKKETLQKKIYIVPCSLQEWKEEFYNYAKQKYDFPICKTKCDSFSENSYNYWFDNDGKNWIKKKYVDWSKTVQNNVRSYNVKLKDWSEDSGYKSANNETVMEF